MRMHWDDVAQRAFDDPKIKPGADPAKDTMPQMARRAFLDSDAGIGIDLFFGGGSFDFAQQAAAGRLVDSGFIRRTPKSSATARSRFRRRSAANRSGTRTARGSGAVLSSFGICYNDDALARLGIADPAAKLGGSGRPEFLRRGGRR